MKCPKCNYQMKKIRVKVQDVDSPVISYQCGRCGYFEFEPKSAKNVIRELKLKE